MVDVPVAAGAVDTLPAGVDIVLMGVAAGVSASAEVSVNVRNSASEREDSELIEVIEAIIIRNIYLSTVGSLNF